MGDKYIDCRFFGNREVILLADFTAHNMTVPEGFRFDGASTPKLFKWLVPKFEGTLKASCRHDWACRNAKNEEERKEADKIFKRMLKEDGNGFIRQNCGYLGVRIGAWFGAGVYY